MIELFSLRHLSDKLCSHLRAMSTIATKEQNADGLLTYLSTTKMDKTSQIKNELPAWDSLNEFFLERICQMLEKFCRRNVVHPRKPVSKIDTFTLQQPFHALCIPFVIQQTILLLVSICFQIWLPQLDKRRRKD